jgi:hypothetical protein
MYITQNALLTTDYSLNLLWNSQAAKGYLLFLIGYHIYSLAAYTMHHKRIPCRHLGIPFTDFMRLLETLNYRKFPKQLKRNCL